MGSWDHYGICKAEKPEDVIDRKFRFKLSEDHSSIGWVYQDFRLNRSLDENCLVNLSRLDFSFGLAWILDRESILKVLKEHPEIYDSHANNKRIPEDFFTSEYYGVYWEDYS